MKVKMNLVMKDPTTTATMRTAGNGYLNLMKRSLNGERRVSPLPEGNGHTMELTRLLEECRVMNEGRDEEMTARICPTLTTDKLD
jgi:hypothetical protein